MMPTSCPLWNYVYYCLLMDSKKVSYSSPLKSSSKKSFLSKRVIFFWVLLLILIGSLVVTKIIMKRPVVQSTSPLETNIAIATQDINHEFSFPLKDSHGEEIGAIQYKVEKAELRNEIIVKGTRATAGPGRSFVVLSLKITNDFKQAVSVNTRDYVRLSVNGKVNESIAPDIHNDPVEVQAISTKPTKVAFPINTSDKDISLWVGELNSEKEQIAITF